MEFWLGVMTMAWVFTLGTSVYAHWRYNYTPWKVIRKDIVALADQDAELRKKLIEIQGEMELRKVLTLSDEDQFRAELRKDAKERLRGYGA